MTSGVTMKLEFCELDFKIVFLPVPVRWSLEAGYFGIFGIFLVAIRLFTFEIYDVLVLLLKSKNLGLGKFFKYSVTNGLSFQTCVEKSSLLFQKIAYEWK